MVISRRLGMLVLLGALSPVGCSSTVSDPADGPVGGPTGDNTRPARPDYGPAEMQTMRDQIQAEIDAEHFTTETWSFRESSGAVDVSFLVIDSLRLVLSASCLQESGELTCGALDGLLAVPGKDVPVGNGTPSVYYCEPAGGTAVAGTGPNGEGNESGFCKFSDGSAISDWSFVYTPNIVLGQNPAEG